MKIDEKIIEKVVFEILNKLEKNNLHEKNQTQGNVIVFNKSSFNHDKIHQLNQKWNVIEISNEVEEISSSVNKVIFLDATQDLFVKGALGIADTVETKLLSRFIRLDLPIKLVPSADFEWSLQLTNKSKVSNYEEKFMQYKLDLEKFGVQLINWEKLMSGGSLSDSDESVENYYGKLLTQKAVEEINSEKIIISKSTIVTPLARDIAKKLKKDICINEENNLCKLEK